MKFATPRLATAALALLTATACVSSSNTSTGTGTGVDQGNRTGTSDGKPLTAQVAVKPVIRGTMHVKQTHALSHGVHKTAPAGAKLVNYGGNVVAKATYNNIFWGAYWTQGAGLDERKYYNSFLQTIGTAPEFASALTEYASAGKPIGTGTYAGENLISTEPGKAIDDAVIQTTIQDWVNKGLVPAPSLDQVYVLNFPPGTSVTLGTSASCTQFCGFHSTIRTTSGTGGLIRYIVNPHEDCQGCLFEATVKDSATVVLSHEMSELVTDPDVGLATALAAPLSWYDQNNGENGDICAGDPNVTMLGFRIQTEWSNAANACVASRIVTPDFALAGAPATQTINPGDATSFTITGTLSGGFSGAIALTVAGLPTGATGAFTGDAGTTAGATLAIATNAATLVNGTYPLTITGTSGSLTHTATVTLQVGQPAPDFSLAIAPSAISITPGSSGTASVTDAVIGAFASDVALTVSGATTGLTATLSAASINATTPATLTVAADATVAAGSYTITVTGTDAAVSDAGPALSHTATLAVTVGASNGGDFTLALAPTSAAVNPGDAAGTVITIAGGSADVSLSAASDYGINIAFDTFTVTGGAGTAHAIITTDGWLGAGVHAVIFTAQSGSFTHTAEFDITVNATAGIIFQDDVENGNVGWTTYSASGFPWRIEQISTAHSGSHRWRSNPGTNYQDGDATFLVSPSFDLSATTTALFHFFYKFHTEDQFDFFYVWVSGDDGATWNKLASGSGASNGWSKWAPEAQFDLGLYVGQPKVRVAFSLQTDVSVNDWGAAVDDVLVTGDGYVAGKGIGKGK